MGAKVPLCPKGYSTEKNPVEFSDNNYCPVSGARTCEECKIEIYINKVNK